MSTIRINGIETAVPAGAIAYKYADPTEGARWVYEQSDLDDIRREDPSLIVGVPNYGIQVQTEAGRDFRVLAGWDSVYTSRADAEAAAERARKHWDDVRVVEYGV